MANTDGIDVLQAPTMAGGEPRLSVWDDLPVHDRASVLAASAPAQDNWAERYYFNVLRGSGEIAAILGAGIYPQRGVAECYFCRLEGSKQHNVRACQPLSRDHRSDQQAFSLRCITPMSTWDATVAVDGGRFDARYSALTKPYHYSKVAIAASEPGGPYDDWQHVVAAGRWDIKTLQGNDVTDDYRCIRDRTWGVRTRRLRLHNWLVFEIDGVCINVLHQERADGSTLYSEGGVAWADGRNERLSVSAFEFEFDPYTREARAGTFDLRGDNGELRLEYETVGLGIRLNGAGYDDSQGARAAAVQSDIYELSEAETARRTGRGTIDIGARVRVTGAWRGEGTGVVESAIARDHARFGAHIA